MYVIGCFHGDLLYFRWSRYVAEQNPVLGKVLVKGVRAYREAKWPQALLYYMLAADAGLEVGNFNLAYLCEENQVNLAYICSAFPNSQLL